MGLPPCHVLEAQQGVSGLCGCVCAGAPAAFFLSQHGLRRMAGPGGRPGTFWLKVTPVAYSVCSSLVGAQAVLFSTSLAILGRQALAGRNELGTWFTGVLVAGLIASATFWIVRLNQVGACSAARALFLPSTLAPPGLCSALHSFCTSLIRHLPPCPNRARPPT